MKRVPWIACGLLALWTSAVPAQAERGFFAELNMQGRILFGIAIVGFGVLCLLYIDFVHQLQPVPSWVPGRRLLAGFTGIALIAAGVAIAAGVKVYPATIVAGSLARRRLQEVGAR